ncbi:protein NRT1/ PTR FAMILY 1.1-like [Macadamia integrifolia]|uniref:protein NRT1/ PTR FAMILY 1.1-like n=1 Tax=Macadamia integrifolia TaxID=60698 RepID=UPI001C52851F|nr:protein NRT1/ PTR FAMILY 1.1-like [Macadamia integrifolia]
MSCPKIYQPVLEWFYIIGTLFSKPKRSSPLLSEKVASYGLMHNMIFYLTRDYNLNAATGTTIFLLWSAHSNAFAIVGAFLSDSYLGQFRVIVLGSFSILLGMILLWFTAVVPETKPSSPLSQPSSSQLALLFSSFLLMSIGAGCIRPYSIAFGADQLINKDRPNNEVILQSFFNWFYASTGVSTILAVTVIVYIQDHFGWKVGFAVPAFLMLIVVLLFLVGSPLYVKVKASKSSVFQRYEKVRLLPWKILAAKEVTHHAFSDKRKPIQIRY